MNSLFQGTYDSFYLSPELTLGLQELGYTAPTSVQNEVFKPIQEGQDLVVQSHTGSGKTTAFCLPLLTRIHPEKYPQVLVLSPTRELAKQVSVEATRLSHHTPIQVTAIYGGVSFEAQLAALKAGAQFIVGTPGRIKDLFEKKRLDLSRIHTVVLDEADEMLSMGFWDDVTYLLNQTPQARQTLLFSATLPWVIEQALSKITRNPNTIQLTSDQATAQSIRHVVHVEDDRQIKSRSLLYAIELHKPKRAIVFCNTKEETEILENYLKRFSIHAQALNGDMSQSARERVLDELKHTESSILIATDVAARGIDVPGLTHVFNYELPDNPESYVHRTGRTGRIGHIGTAISLIRDKDELMLSQLQKTYELSFERVPFPAESEILWMQSQRLAQLLIEQAEQVEISQYRPVAESLLGRPDLAEVLAFLLRSHFSKITQPSKPTQSAPRPKAPSVQKLPEHRDLYVTLGRQDGFTNLAGLANHVSDLSKVDLGHFTGQGNLRDTSSHLEVDYNVANQIKEALHGLARASGVTETITCDFGSGKPQKPRTFHKDRRFSSKSDKPNPV